MIYFLQRDDELIKIGTTRHFYRRLAQLEKEHSITAVLGWQVGNHKEETALHLKFAACRVVDEWFYPSVDLMDYIASVDVNQGPPVKPERNLSNDQLWQMVKERDAYIKNLLMANSNGQNDYLAVHRGLEEAAKLILELKRMRREDREKIRRLEAQLALTQRETYSEGKTNMKKSSPPLPPTSVNQGVKRSRPPAVLSRDLKT